MKDLISIIVPIYCVEDYLEDCIDSIINQTYKNLEIILVDDGSPDECPDICDRYAQKDKRIKVIHKVNGGLSDARNVGIGVANGDYLGFVDGDDYIDRDMYEELYKGIKVNNATVSCCALYKECKNSTKIISVSNANSLFTPQKAIKEVLLEGSVNVSVCCKLYSRTVFDTLRFPAGRVNEDEAVVIESLSNGLVYHIGEPKYHYQYRENSITNHYGEKGAHDMMHNMCLVYKKVIKTYPELQNEVKQYACKRSYDVLMIYNVEKIDRDLIYYKAKKIYNKNWHLLLKKEKKKKDIVLYILERVGILKILFYIIK